jgi:hypothetical protein
MKNEPIEKTWTLLDLIKAPRKLSRDELAQRDNREKAVRASRRNKPNVRAAASRTAARGRNRRDWE